MKMLMSGMMALVMSLLFIACNSEHYALEKDVSPSIILTATDSTNVVADDARQLSQEGEAYDRIIENPFVNSQQQPLSTFSIDVDRAAYSNVRRYIQGGTLPPKNAVRIEEMINYFKYDYPQPADENPFAIYTEIAPCPWNEQHRLLHIGLQGKEIDKTDLPAANLVFLVDVSGSMNEQNKLPLVQSSLKMLASQLRGQDRVAIVTYAGNAGLLLPSVKGTEREKINEAIDALSAGGSTAGGEGIKLAYQVARDHFIRNGNNRVILATDGDFNVGVSSEEELVSLIEMERKSNVFLTVLGFGTGNYQDGKMQQLADKGNGNHAYIDNSNEARKVLVNEFGGTLFTIAKDVKLQLEFNPTLAKAYRLIGYENRVMPNEDFHDDAKDAGELGAGHTVTALYEIIPAGVDDEFTKKIPPLKYQVKQMEATNLTNELLTIQLRYKAPKEDKSKLIVHPVLNETAGNATTSINFRFSAAVAEFGLVLRQSQYQQTASYEKIIAIAKAAKGEDEDGSRAEFIKLAETASLLDERKSVVKN